MYSGEVLQLIFQNLLLPLYWVLFLFCGLVKKDVVNSCQARHWKLHGLFGLVVSIFEFWVFFFLFIFYFLNLFSVQNSRSTCLVCICGRKRILRKRSMKCGKIFVLFTCFVHKISQLQSIWVLLWLTDCLWKTIEKKTLFILYQVILMFFLEAFAISPPFGANIFLGFFERMKTENEIESTIQTGPQSLKKKKKKTRLIQA